MAYTAWQKQTADKPLFPEILWSRPENRNGAGKLLIIGGNAHAISAPVTAYQYALDASAGSARVIMPDHVKKAFGKFVQEAEFAPSNPSGGFAVSSLDTLLMQAEWADTVLLAGDFGHNSETSIVLEKFLQKTSKPVVITHDAVECLYGSTEQLVKRPKTLLVTSFAQAQKLAIHAKATSPLKFDSSLLQIVETLHELSKSWQASLLTRHLDTYFVCSAGQIVTSPAPNEKIWRVRTATRASVFWMQNPLKLFESVTSSLQPSKDS